MICCRKYWLGTIALFLLSFSEQSCKTDQPASPINPQDTVTTSDRYEWKMIRRYPDPSSLYNIRMFSDNEIWFAGEEYHNDTASLQDGCYGMLCLKNDSMSYYKIESREHPGTWAISDVIKYENGNVYGIYDAHFAVTKNGIVSKLINYDVGLGIYLAGYENNMYLLEYGYYYVYNGSTFRRVDVAEGKRVTAVYDGGETIYATLIDKNNVEPISVLIINKDVPRIWTGMPWKDRNSGIYPDNRGTVYFCGGPQLGKYSNGVFGDAMPKQKSILGDVHGTAWNNVWTVGTNGTVLHYNGKAWVDLTKEVNFPRQHFTHVRCTENTVCALGWSSSDVGILIGRKIQ
jgi:hypothetical protein